jgi:long-chain fatty acid transport protein
MRTALVALALWLGVVATAHASPLLELVGGFGGQGALQARHAGPSPASAYFNPALLTDATPGLSAGVLVLNSELGVRVDARGAQAAVPDGLVNAYHADGSRFSTYPIATDLLQNGRPADSLTPALRSRPRQHAGTGHQTHSYEALGLVVKMFHDRLALGFYGLIPNASFTNFSSFYVDEREQYFSNSLHPELYGDRLTALSLAFAAGVRLSDTFSVGMGATLGLRALAEAPVYVADAGRLQDVQVNTDVRVKMTLVPHGGFSWNPGRWHLTGTLHAPQKLQVKAGFQFLLATGIEQGSSLAFTYDYQPWQAGAGVGYDVLRRGDITWTATGSLLYGRWSRYFDRQAARPRGEYAWSDTLGGAIGSRVQVANVGVALDGQYQPTPVPLQTGRSNYVDNDRLGLALAVDYAFQLWGTKLRAGAQLQSYRMLARRQTKRTPPTRAQGENQTPQLVTDEVPDDAVISETPVSNRAGVQTNNPGWPGFSSQGWVSSAGLYLCVAF